MKITFSAPPPSLPVPFPSPLPPPPLPLPPPLYLQNLIFHLYQIFLYIKVNRKIGGLISSKKLKPVSSEEGHTFRLLCVATNHLKIVSHLSEDANDFFNAKPSSRSVGQQTAALSSTIRCFPLH